MKYECYPQQRLIRNDTCRYRKNDRKEGLIFCKSLSKVTFFFFKHSGTLSVFTHYFIIVLLIDI